MIVQKLNQLSRRERILILLAIAFLLAWFGFSMVWQPYDLGRAAVDSRLQRLEIYINRLARIPAATQAGQVDADAVPTSVLAQSAEDAGLAISSLQTTADGASVILDESPFDAVLLWIDRIERDSGLSLVKIQILRGNEAGKVTATIDFEGWR